MTWDDKREIWEVILESAKHSELAPYILVNELVAAHGVLCGDDKSQRNPILPITAKDVETMTAKEVRNVLRTLLTPQHSRGN